MNNELLFEMTIPRLEIQEGHEKKATQLKLVEDTNILFSALIKNSTTRSVLLNPNHNFYVPEFVIEEVR
jgi:predicted nucleic acid-binding protein